MSPTRTALVATSSLAAAGLSGYYFSQVVNPPVVYHAPNSPVDDIVKKCTSLYQPLWSTPWVCGPRAQLVVRQLKKNARKKFPGCQFTRTLIHHNDGGVTALDWLADVSLPSNAPVVIFHHTITATSDDQYGLSGFLKSACARGFRPVVSVRRGHGELPLKTPVFNTAGRTTDVRDAVCRVSEMYPEAPIAMIGLSAGSVLCMRYVGEEGLLRDTGTGPLAAVTCTPPPSTANAGATAPSCGRPVELPRVVAAVAVCPAFDLPTAWNRCQPLFQDLMLDKIRDFFVHRNGDVLKDSPGFSSLISAESLPEFDSAAALFSGFSSYAEAVDRASPCRVLGHVGVPLLCVAAADDPLCVLEGPVVEQLKQKGVQTRHSEEEARGGVVVSGHHASDENDTSSSRKVSVPSGSITSGTTEVVIPKQQQSHDDTGGGGQHKEVVVISDHVVLAVTPRGSHLGFLEGLRGSCWAERVALDFVEQALLEEASSSGRTTAGGISRRTGSSSVEGKKARQQHHHHSNGSSGGVNGVAGEEEEAVAFTTTTSTTTPPEEVYYRRSA